MIMASHESNQTFESVQFLIEELTFDEVVRKCGIDEKKSSSRDAMYLVGVEKMAESYI